MILVTGSNGFLGRAVVEQLLLHGETEIRCLVRSNRARNELDRVCESFPNARIEILSGDLTAPPDAVHAVKNVKTIYHLAAQMKGDPADLFLNTVVGSKNLLDAAVAESLERVILVSSFGVYGTSELPKGTLVTETTPLETHPERRDVYSHCKLRQEQLFWEYYKKHGFELVVMRPGVVYGPGGTAISARVGLNIFGIFWRMGGSNLLPLTYVDNCAEAIVLAGGHPQTSGEVYNVVDDELVSAKQLLSSYRSLVKRLKVLPIPYVATHVLSRWIERYHLRSKGQLPAILTPYKSAGLWKGNTFDNSKLKSIGWRPSVGTADGIQRCFSYFRSLEAAL